MSPVLGPAMSPNPHSQDSLRMASASSTSCATSADPTHLTLYIPATDIGPLLNIRKNNIPSYISKYDSLSVNRRWSTVPERLICLSGCLSNRDNLPNLFHPLHS